MWKFVIIIIFLLGAGFGIPKTRARLMPFFAPVIEKLGPVGRKITAPAKRWSAKNEETVLLQKLQDQHADHKELPTPLEFQTWMHIYTHGENRGLDPWGHPYYLIHEQHQITVGSQGPDRVRNTADDVRTSATIQ
jgi:hypothetical protein